MTLILEEGPQIAALVAAAQAGDPDALTAIYRAFAPRVFRYIAFRVGASGEADDLTQQSFLKMIEALPRYQDRGLPFGAWLFRIVRNTVIDFERARREPLALDDPTLVIVDRSALADQRSAEDRAVLELALASLTKDQRDVVACRFFADLSVAETGRLMDRGPATVRTLQARALAALRRVMRADDATATGRVARGDVADAVVRRQIQPGFDGVRSRPIGARAVRGARR